MRAKYDNSDDNDYDQDYLIIDEASMISNEDWIKVKLIIETHNYHKIIILGDTKQLQPVGKGQLYNILCDKSNTLYLNHTFRSDNQSIITHSKNIINKGVFDGTRFNKKDISYILDDIDNRQIIVYNNTRRKDINENLLNIQHKNNIYKYKFICNDNEDKCKGKIFTYISNTKLNFKERNNNHILIDSIGYNGELCLAYCITIHKSQGAEWDEVIVDVDSFDGVNCNLAYVAATRPIKNMYVVTKTRTKILSFDKRNCCV